MSYTDGLTFTALRRANEARLPLYKNAQGEPCHAKPDGSDWSPAQWLQALTGELGEYANLRKKFERGDFDEETFREMAKKELADVQIYLDILAKQLGINLGDAVMEKWDETSAKLSINLTLRPDDWAYRVPPAWLENKRLPRHGDKLFNLQPLNPGAEKPLPVGSDLMVVEVYSHYFWATDHGDDYNFALSDLLGPHAFLAYAEKEKVADA